MSRFAIIFLGFCLASFDDAAAARGATEISSRIYGGKSVDITEAPYMAALYYYDEYICSGTIIDPYYILTAAHCVAGRAEAELTVRVGSTKQAEGGSVIQVEEVMLNPDYNPDTNENDVAVLFLYDRIETGDSTKVIPLGNKTPKPDVSVTVAGWGSTEGKKGASDVLQMATVSVIPRSECVRLYKHIGTVGKKAWCAVDLIGNKDTCDGDSGGPAVAGDKVVGITSWGKGCGVRSQPGVYMDVSKFRDWIEEALSTYN